MKKISFVIPCYGSRGTILQVLDELSAEIKKLSGFQHEIILVDDASPDGLFEIIRALPHKRKNFKVIKLSKNFGQQAALLAGQAHAEGDYIVCMDDDGQTPVGFIGSMIKKIEEGFDVVYASFNNKNMPLLRRFGTWMNMKMAEWLIDKPKQIGVSSFFIMRKFINEQLVRYKKPYPYNVGLVLSVTKNIGNVECQSRERISGKTGYTFGKLLSLWLNGFTAFSVKPLRWASYIGFAVASAGIMYGVYIVIRKITDSQYILAGWSSMMAVQLFLSGVIMIMLGLTGEYMSRIYMSSNERPQYVIKEKITGKPGR